MIKIGFVYLYPQPKKYSITRNHLITTYDEIEFNNRQLDRLFYGVCPTIRNNHNWSKQEMAKWKFYNKKLSAKEKQQFTAWTKENEADMPIYIQEVLHAGYKISVSQDTFNETMTASLTPSKDVKTNKDGSLVAKHSDYYIAILIVVFKHVVLAEGGSWESMEMDEEDWG